ncbi:MAG: hypothetical protein ACF8MF_07255 [Phycisphaerales bacterium JB052]
MPAISGFIISLTPSKLSVIYARRGRVQQTESVSLDYDQWAEHWNDGLMRLDQPLRQLLSRFRGSKRMSATLLYQSNTCTKQIYPFDQGGAFARDAARSKLRECIGLTDPVSVCALGDQSGTAESCTMLAYSDREDILRSLYAWLNRAGVDAVGMIPLSVASIIFAAKDASRFDNQTAILYLGAENSIIAHCEQGELSLVRPADIGFSKLVESYRQVFSEQASENADNPVPTQEAPTPVECLFEYGVPFKPIECAGIELRSTVLPCMAPALQRICIDIKQTIRFGIGSKGNLKNLYISGPGASIPSITKAIGEHIDLHVQPVPGAEGYQPLLEGGGGSVELQLIETVMPTPGILPGIAGDEQVRRSLKTALVAGGAIAMVVMGAEYTHSTITQQRMNEQARNVAPLVQQVAQFEQSREKAKEVASLLGGIADLVAEQNRSTPEWVGPLAKLSEYAGEEVRVQEIRGDQGDSGFYIDINGYAVGTKDIAPGQALDRFVDSLRQNVCTQSINLGATSRLDLSSNPGSDQSEPPSWGLQFTLRVKIKAQESPYSGFAQVSPEQTDWIAP